MSMLFPSQKRAPSWLVCYLVALTFLLPGVTQAQESSLPSIGGAGGGLISEQQESEIGRQVMISIRRSAPQITDPLVYSYLNDVIYRLVPSAPLKNRDLTLAIIDSPDINAFAVPGSIVGINGGLVLNASSEQQFASVLAHELAHPPECEQRNHRNWNGNDRGPDVRDNDTQPDQ